jgi:hypothetical protein
VILAARASRPLSTQRPATAGETPALPGALSDSFAVEFGENLLGVGEFAAIGLRN